jgi:hypothetical protein
LLNKHLEEEYKNVSGLGFALAKLCQKQRDELGKNHQDPDDCPSHAEEDPFVEFNKDASKAWFNKQT